MAAASQSGLFEAISATGPSRAETLARLDAISRVLDTAFVIPGTNIRFGVDGIISLVPGIGDMISTVLSSYLVYEARRLGLPKWKIARMIGNVAFQGLVGMVPLAGDAVDILFRANRRNMRILREHFAEDWQQAIAARGAAGQRAGTVIDGEYRVVEGRHR